MTNFFRCTARAGIIAIALGSVALPQQPETTQPLSGNTSSTTQFVPFDKFLADSSDNGINIAATAKVANTAALTEMRDHITKMYQGVHVTHSFVQGSQTYDCIPVEQQPSLRMAGSQGIAAPPTAPRQVPGTAAGAAAAFLEQTGKAAQASLLPAAAVDGFGNATACEDHTVPIQRTTVEQISRFSTLRAFLSKSPDGKGMPPVPLKPGAAPSTKPAPPSFGAHFHDYTYQNVRNLGGNSNINIWDPGVATIWGEVFSLSQVWYLGLSSTGTLQTVEAGWQSYPGRLGDGNPHLFVYFTADGYNKTGCYDHSCSGFVQYSSRVFPGVALPRSIPTGNQTEIATLWQWWSGNWWLSVNGEWIGYYPGSLFGTGEMATHSSWIEYGGEILAGQGTSYVYNPEMGSGSYAQNGFQIAAYQRQIWYFDALGSRQPASLSGVNECPAGTSIVGPYNGGPYWGIYFFFGGPGGFC